MKGKRVLLAFALLIALGGSIYPVWKYLIQRRFSQWVQTHTFLQGEDGVKMVFNPENVVEIKIKNPSGVIAFEKDDKGVWYITEPVHARASRTFATDLPFKIVSVEEKESVETNPKDLSKYYLDNPDIVVQFRLKDSKQWRSVQFGRRSPTGSKYYTYNPDTKKVFLTDFTVKFDFNADYDGYMDKLILPHPISRGNRAVFEFTDETYEYSFNTDTNFWGMEKPMRGNVHQQGFFSFLSSLDQIESLKPLEPAEIPSDAGFDHPALRMTFSKTGEWAVTLFIGREFKPGIRYAKLADSPGGYLIASDYVDTIRDRLKNTGSYYACYFPQYGVKRIEFIIGNTSFVFLRDSKESRTYQLEGNPEAKVNYGALANFILKLFNTLNRGYTGDAMPGAPAKYGFDKPLLTIKMDFFNPYYTNVTLYYGNKDPSGEFIYSYNSRDPGILKTDAALTQAFPKSASDFFMDRK